MDGDGRMCWEGGGGAGGQQHKYSQREKCGAVAGTEAGLGFCCGVKVN